MVLTQQNFFSTERTNLIAATLRHINAELESKEKLAELINAIVTPEWPPGEYDEAALKYFHSQFLEKGEELNGWLGWYAVKRATEDEPAVLVGAGGYFGPPSEKGEVEIGYSVVPAFQRRGFATEIVKALVDIGFSDCRVNRIIAHTAQGNEASKIVLVKSGFKLVGIADNGNILFELLK